MKIWIKAQHRLDEKIENLIEYLDKLSVRERMMVITATIVVVVAVIGSAVWKMHDLAESEQKRLSTLKDDLVWMQTHVATMKTAEDLNLTVQDKIQRVSQQQGLSVASQQVGGSTQIVAEHQQYAILANYMTQLAQMGLSIEKMQMIKEGQQIKLTATVK